MTEAPGDAMATESIAQIVGEYVRQEKLQAEIAQLEAAKAAEAVKPTGWRSLDVKTISIIGAILIQAFAMGGWVANVMSRQGETDRTVAALKAASEAAAATLRDRMDRLDSERSVGLQRLAAVEQATKDIVIELAAINAKLDRLVEKQHSELIPPLDR